ncbi:hypothetical protein GPLA_2083 [Paraglaciecola polaris LMG 21857]|uniref:Uncharacterized protein n=1 Tax=Paraglaciecola polaris LMG 21857 TaxID=1129793 RepID=K6ZW28_9ALTE|nr:hypothetical protein GPLA_2083 [Paraglaciecola polaris LMG 21857]
MAVVLCFSSGMTGCQSAHGKTATLFSEIDVVILFEDLPRRKWDNVVIADLEQNGFKIS